MAASLISHLETPPSVHDSLISTWLNSHGGYFILSGSSSVLADPSLESNLILRLVGRLSWDSRCWEISCCFRVWWRSRMRLCLSPGRTGSIWMQCRGTSTGRAHWRIMGTRSRHVSAMTLLVSSDVWCRKGLLQSAPWASAIHRHKWRDLESLLWPKEDFFVLYC